MSNQVLTKNQPSLAAIKSPIVSPRQDQSLQKDEMIEKMKNQFGEQKQMEETIIQKIVTDYFKQNGFNQLFPQNERNNSLPDTVFKQNEKAVMLPQIEGEINIQNIISPSISIPNQNSQNHMILNKSSSDFRLATSNIKTENNLSSSRYERFKNTNTSGFFKIDKIQHFQAGDPNNTINNNNHTNNNIVIKNNLSFEDTQGDQSQNNSHILKINQYLYSSWNQNSFKPNEYVKQTDQSDDDNEQELQNKQLYTHINNDNGQDEWSKLAKLNKAMMDKQEEKKNDLAKQKQIEMAKFYEKQIEERKQIQKQQKERDRQGYIDICEKLNPPQPREHTHQDNKQYSMQLENFIWQRNNRDRKDHQKEQLVEQTLLNKILSQEEEEKQRENQKRMMTKQFYLDSLKESLQEKKKLQVKQKEERQKDKQLQKLSSKLLDDLEEQKKAQKLQRLQQMQSSISKAEKIKQRLEEQQREEEKMLQMKQKEWEEKEQQRRIQEQEQQLEKKQKEWEKKMALKRQYDQQIEIKNRRIQEEKQLKKKEGVNLMNNASQYFQQQKEFHDKSRNREIQNQELIKMQIQNKIGINKKVNMTLQQLLQNQSLLRTAENTLNSSDFRKSDISHLKKSYAAHQD